jgi:hypothetical protein
MADNCVTSSFALSFMHGGLTRLVSAPNFHRVFRKAINHVVEDMNWLKTERKASKSSCSAADDTWYPAFRYSTAVFTDHLKIGT